MELFVKVKVLNDNYKNDNVKKNDIGYILENYNDGNYEVQFWDESTYPPVSLAIISVNENDIEEVEK